MTINPTTQHLTAKGADDFELVRMAREGCQQSYARLMERHQSSIYHLMLRMTRNSEDAHDLTQEAFGKAFTRMAMYVPNYAFSTWLYKIALNNAIDFVRRKRLTTLSIDEAIDAEGAQDYSAMLHATGPNPEEAVIRDQRIGLMRRTLACLNDKYRIMIELRYFQELSYEEISVELGIPLGTVKAQLFRAKELLAEMLNNNETSAYVDIRMSRRAVS